MPTPFDPILQNIVGQRYHNQRKPEHSDLLTDRIIEDLDRRCEAFADDRRAGRFTEWRNVAGPDDRNTDLLIGGSKPNGVPDLEDVRIVVEHKSILTAHRNRNSRFHDIERGMHALHAKNPSTIFVATLIVGTCRRFLNISDGVKKACLSQPGYFEQHVLPRLSSGDDSLWREFPQYISENSESDPSKTIEMFRRLPIRHVSDSHRIAMDFVLFIPMDIDNVNPPNLVEFDGIDPCAEYDRMIDHICLAYQIRWHGRV